jgi:hypothetical protein
MDTFDGIISDARRRLFALAGQMITRTQAVQLVPPAVVTTRAKRARRRAKGTENVWIADSKARRVPTWVIQMTGGLDTKKKIVERFGADARFEVGKALPAILTAAARKALKHPAPAPVPATTQRQAAA